MCIVRALMQKIVQASATVAVTTATEAEATVRMQSMYRKSLIWSPIQHHKRYTTQIT